MASEINLSDIAERLKGTRGDLTQAQFAEQLGVSAKTVVRWEHGSAVPDGASLYALMVNFEVEPGWVLTGLGKPPGLTGPEAALLKNYRQSGVRARKAIDAMAAASGSGEQAPNVPTRGASLVFNAEVKRVAGGDMHNYAQPRDKRTRR